MTDPALYTRETVQVVSKAARRGVTMAAVARELGWSLERLRRLAWAHGILFPLDTPPAEIAIMPVKSAEERRIPRTVNSGTLPRNDRISPFSFQLAASVQARVRLRAAAEQISVSEWLRRAVAAELARGDAEAAE